MKGELFSFSYAVNRETRTTKGIVSSVFEYFALDSLYSTALAGRQVIKWAGGVCYIIAIW